MFSLERLKNLKLIDLIQPKIVRFVWSAILDEKVCDLCRSLDGKVMDANSPEYTIYKSPIHPRCRCTQIPITSDAEIIPEPNFEKPKDSWIIRYAPFWFIIPFKGKKKGPLEVFPFAPESPNPEFNPEEILDIQREIVTEQIQNNIDITKEKVKDYLAENNIILIVFTGVGGATILEKELNIEEGLTFTLREKKLIKEKAKSYIMPNSFLNSDEYEYELKKKFGLRNKF